MGFETFGKCSCCGAVLNGGNHNGCKECSESMCDECTRGVNGEPICTVCHAHLEDAQILQSS